jgi:hypothetical protein
MPDAVWVRIFQLIQDADFTDWMYFNDVAKTQANLHGLRLVCKEFDDVFKRNPDVTRLLYLPRSLSSQSLGSVLKWLRINTLLIRGLRADCRKSYFQEVLSELQSIALVTTVSIDECDATKVLLLSRLTGLEHCMLFSKSTGRLDLKPLQSLTSLKRLSLDFGNFIVDQLPPNLTDLTLTDSACLTARQPCSCVSSLKTLEMSDGAVLDLHPQGVSACSALTELDCSDSTILAQDPQKVLGLATCNNLLIPVGFSSLRQLVNLSLWIQSDSEDELDLSCLYGLTALQSLSVSACEVSVIATAGLTNLSRLTYLSFCVWELSVLKGREGPANPDLILKLDIDWCKMQLLQTCCISATFLACDTRLLQMVDMCNLKTLHFSDLNTVDSGTCTLYGRLLCSLVMQRPDIDLRLDKYCIKQT